MQNTNTQKLVDYIYDTKDRVTSNIHNPYAQEMNFKSSENSYFITENDVNQFEQFYAGLFESLQSSFELCVQNKSLFLEYFDNASLHQLLSNSKFDISRGVFRHDVLQTNGALKLLEVNGGANIGGWELDMFAPMQLEYLNKTGLFAQDTITYRSIVESMFNNLATHIAALEKKELSGNIGVLIPEENYNDTERTSFYNNFLNSIYLNSKQYKQGHIHLLCNEKCISVQDDKGVYHGDTPLDALLTLEYISSEELHEQLLVSHMQNKIFCSDSLLNELLCDKSIMALLHDPRILEQQPQSIREWIVKYVPWSIRLDHYLDGSFASSSQVDIKNNKDDYVLKKRCSLQGKDVYIGRFMEEDAWLALLNNVENTSDWIIQQYYPSDLLPTFNADLEVISTPFVWGLFDFNGEYGGSTLRAFISAEESGVINAANGAVVVTVFEEHPVVSK
ncbi:hypothetical protein BB427_16370 [Pseudoalteromonas sp. BMB]|uniref:hypothetical protein n=1 Tax=Pseudoalteromonas sp. BMB TaxID=1874619 RepID=UPI00083D49E9|nr:hypothetical protein [Pseudoalteromonas sp. BMB]ODB35881.1 hypothetical protein BB427_16370 [Pseudoalteromonas sp. BMB]